MSGPRRPHHDPHEGRAEGRTETLKRVALQLLPQQFGPTGTQLAARLQQLDQNSTYELVAEALLQGADLAHIQTLIG